MPAPATSTIKVAVFIEPARKFDRALLRGIHNYCRQQGHWALYRPSFPYPRGPRHMTLEQLHRWGAHALITRESAHIATLLPHRWPMVIVPHDQVVDGAINVVSDYPAMGRMAAEHLLERGFVNFAFCTFYRAQWPQQQASGFQERLAQDGFHAETYFQPKSRKQWRWEDEEPLLVEWLQKLPKPVAIMAAPDERASHIVEACKVTGLTIPDEVAVLGVDNDDLICEFSDPPISSIELSTEQAGYDAAAALDSLLHGRPVTEPVVLIRPLYVAPRRSTDVFQIADTNIRHAVEFIRRHAKRSLGVDDVVDVTTLSRRTLQKKFKKLLGHSVLEEIRRARVQEVKHLLIDTNLTVSEIAVALRFPTESHISRYFRQVTGTTPRAFRLEHRRRLTP